VERSDEKWRGKEKGLQTGVKRDPTSVYQIGKMNRIGLKKAITIGVKKDHKS